MSDYKYSIKVGGDKMFYFHNDIDRFARLVNSRIREACAEQVIADGDIYANFHSQQL